MHFTRVAWRLVEWQEHDVTCYPTDFQAPHLPCGRIPSYAMPQHILTLRHFDSNIFFLDAVFPPPVLKRELKYTLDIREISKCSIKYSPKSLRKCLIYRTVLMRRNYWKYLDAYHRSLDILRLLLCKAQLVLLYPNMETWQCFRNKHVIHTARSPN